MHPPGRRRSTPRRSPVCCPTSASRTYARSRHPAGAGDEPRCGSTSERAAPGSRSAPAPAWPRSPRRWWWPPRSPRPRGSGRRTVAPITAEQVEEVGQHLLTRQYSEPHWSSRAGAVMAYEQVSLYGVPIVARRRVAYGSIDPDEARAIFLRSALVEGRWRTHHQFFRANAELRAEVEALEERTRRRDLAVDDETIMAFYEARIPAGITSAAHFDTWWKQARRDRSRPAHAALVGPDGDRTSEPDPADFPVSLAGGRSGAGPGLRVRPGPAGRRGDGAGAGGSAQPARCRRRSAGRCPGCGPSSPPS